MATSAAPLRGCPAADAQIIANITPDCDLISHLPTVSKPLMQRTIVGVITKGFAKPYRKHIQPSVVFRAQNRTLLTARRRGLSVQQTEWGIRPVPALGKSLDGRISARYLSRGAAASSALRVT
jgi:hypothetical protein